MTRDEALSVAVAVTVADGGCPRCVGEIFNRLNEAGLGWRFMLCDSDDPRGIPCHSPNLQVRVMPDLCCLSDCGPGQEGAASER